VHLAPNCGGVLIAGSSGIGKSTLATALSERMVEKGLQFCVFDPEGDYGELEHAVSVGDTTSPPARDETLKLLRTQGVNVVVNTQALGMPERPTFFAALLPEVAALRARTGRPHWLVIDEAHHLLAADRGDVVQIVPEQMPASIFITVHPDAMARAALQTVHHVITLGRDAYQTLVTFCRQVGIDPPPEGPPHGDEQVLYWARGSEAPPQAVDAIRPTQAHRRHTRKYAAGDVGDESFYFRGRDGKLKLRAQNLMIFEQIAEGLDADTWEHHRRAGDYSTWFRDVIKDDGLAEEASAVEGDASLDADESRRRVLEAVARRYTAPARAPAG